MGEVKSMPRQRQAHGARGAFVKIERPIKAVRDLPDLPVDREKLKWDYISKLGRKRAEEMLISVHEAQAIINGLKGDSFF